VDELVTRRLSWRPATPADFDGYFALVSDFEVVRMLGSWPWPPDPAFTRARLAPVDPASGFVGPVFAGAEMVGSCGIIEGDMGAAIGRAHWGRGYASEIAEACLDAAFSRYDWAEVTASCWADNPASARVLEKLGFAATGPGRDFCKARGEELADRRYTMTREAWEARP
jgi:ribosomal-protein-alanine N-acetyltransferase